jgi:dihydroorotase
MNILLEKASVYNPEKREVVTDNFLLTEQGLQTAEYKEPASKIIENALIAPAFTDVLTHVGAPGYEHDETVHTLEAAAKAGGYNTILAQPYLMPALDTAESIVAFKTLWQKQSIDVKPIASLHSADKAQSLSEIFELHQAGVKHFTIHPTQTIPDMVLLKGMELLNALQCTLIIKPTGYNLYPTAQMSEGKMSNSLGLKGLPSFTEKIAIQKIIELVKYTRTTTHVACISSAESANLIDQAKQDGLPITCSVSIANLFFNDEALIDYNTSYKLHTPLQNETNRLALIDALLNGKIDCVIANHTPKNSDRKQTEFDNAAFGSAGLETAYAALQTLLGKEVDAAKIGHWLGGAVNIALNISSTHKYVQLNANESFVLNEINTKSKSKNCAFNNKSLQGTVNLL